MPKQDIFQEKKRKILQALSKPDDEYTDSSPIGAVDPNIRQLVDQINETDGYVTTSSCAGRISVFLEGAAKVKDDSGNDEGRTSSSAQGKGGGSWLFVSHDPVDVRTVQEYGALFELFSLPKEDKRSFPSADENVRFVHFKFEPMILHILTSSLAHAQHCHSAAMSAGFRESGIVGVTGPEPTPHVAIRTQGLALESIIAYQDSAGAIWPMVPELYLLTLLNLANQRFVANAERKERFARNLLQPKGKDHRKGNAGEWEPANVRRERKRAEGLKRKEELQRLQQSGSAELEKNHHNEDVS
ncbi:hypothetical protein CBER1_01565 [Cercospora berteroae]|uniref:tRNA(Phe) 7-[(3-amino-3-carboxypropyl)-4-demethylwyosine(37)-N(4)]-methyltransferase n=1 Tax=Cercospora berteroae TaxID=357750 RepID=A0A2S6C7R3_9PEZI|nr:hypothetical protein CBER1_01565 [Cercospora berteroae]